MAQGATVEGTPVTVGKDREGVPVVYVIPDPTIETAESVALKLEAIASSTMTVKVLVDIAELVALAARENYPDLQGAHIKKVLKLKDATRVMREVLVAVGLEAPATGEVVAP